MTVLTAEKKYFNSLSREQKQGLFHHFCDLEIKTGGPDPHIDTACSNAAGLSPEQQAWLIACYIIPYSGAGGAAIYGAFPTPDAALERLDAPWVRTNWHGVPSRDERKTVWQTTSFVNCTHGVARWIKSGLFEQVMDAPDYDTAWVLANRIPHFARYAVIKFLEALRRHAGFRHEMPDIRPNGGWSPRRSLMELTGVDDKADDATINRTAAEYRDVVEKSLGFSLDYFRYETLLCNLRQAITGRYPGRSHDSELKYWRKAEAFWGDRDWHQGWDFYGTRARLYDPRLLGEVQGWDGPRPELKDTLTAHGFLWSDLVYNYKATTDFAHPVRW